MIGIFAFLAGGWAVVMGVSPLLQVRRMRQRRSSADVSIGYLFILFPGFALWICYGIASSDVALIVPNVVALAICAITIGYAIQLRERPTRQPADTRLGDDDFDVRVRAGSATGSTRPR